MYILIPESPNSGTKLYSKKKKKNMNQSAVWLKPFDHWKL